MIVSNLQNRNLGLFISILMGLQAGVTFAQEKHDISFSEAMRQAQENSPVLKKSRATFEEASWKTVEARSGYMPNVSGSVSYLLDKRYMITDVVMGGNPMSIPNIVPTTLYSLNVNMNLFDGFATTNRYHAASENEEAFSAEYNWTKFSLKRNVALLYYKALATQALREVAEQNVKALEDHLKDTQLFKKAGISTNYDVLRVEVQVSEAKTELINSEDNFELALGKLAEYLGQDQNLNVVGNLPGVEQYLGVKIDTLTDQDRQDLFSQRKRLESAGDQVSANQSHWWPKLGAFGVWQSYNNRNDRFDDNNNFRDAYQVGLNLTWNFFDGFAAHAKYKQSLEQKAQFQAQYQISQLKSGQDLNFWKRKFKYFSSVYKSRVNDVEKANEAVRLAKEGRRVGARTNSEFLDAEAELFRAKAGAITAQLGFLESLINLELNSGKDLLNY